MRWADLSNKERWTWAGKILVSIITCIILIIIIYYIWSLPGTWLKQLEHSSAKTTAPVIIALLIVVSFPVALGYLALLLSAGYLLGTITGLATILVGANVGIAAAHYTLRMLRPRLPLRRILKRDSAAALFKVISGPQAYKIVFFARLTPIPFGLQNTVFALSEVSGFRYHLASAAGLLPAQMINVYLGSTLRSIHDVIQQSHVTGYVVFCFQIVIGISLMTWIVHRARKELTQALLDTEAGCEGILSSSSSSSSLC